MKMCIGDSKEYVVCLYHPTIGLSVTRDENDKHVMKIGRCPRCTNLISKEQHQKSYQSGRQSRIEEEKIEGLEYGEEIK